MSIKRAHKESISLQLVTLQQFMRYAKESSWPKWLKRKSYYRECDLFFLIYSEATTNRKIPEHVLAESIAYFKNKAKRRPSRKRKYKKRGNPGPAFTNKKRASIFGLKK